MPPLPDSGLFQANPDMPLTTDDLYAPRSVELPHKPGASIKYRFSPGLGNPEGEPNLSLVVFLNGLLNLHGYLVTYHLQTKRNSRSIPPAFHAVLRSLRPRPHHRPRPLRPRTGTRPRPRLHRRRIGPRPTPLNHLPPTLRSTFLGEYQSPPRRKLHRLCHPAAPPPHRHNPHQSLPLPSIPTMTTNSNFNL